jgi:hypothetical protein
MLPTPGDTSGSQSWADIAITLLCHRQEGCGGFRDVSSLLGSSSRPCAVIDDQMMAWDRREDVNATRPAISRSASKRMTREAMTTAIT